MRSRPGSFPARGRPWRGGMPPLMFGSGGGCSVWKRHWKLLRDPFVGVASPYVSVSSHDEAVARLVDTIETGQRHAVIRAAAGLGKSMVLARAVAEARGPWRRAVLL